MALEARIDELRISSGTAIPVPETGVVAIVGPNNTGKSVALRETLEHLTGTPPPPERPRHVVVDIRVHKHGEEDDLREWLETHCRARTERSTRIRSYRRPNAGPVSWDAALSEWQNIPVFGPSLTSFFTLSATAEARLGLVGGTGLWDPWTDVPSNPLQMLFADPELEQRLSELAQQAFGTPLTLSRVAGGAINLHVGTSEVEAGIVPSETYLDALRALPLVMEQGDGMKSFIGIMLALVAAFYPVVMIDEPEAFLHPPQARLLGQRLAREAIGRAQVIVATHSTDVLLGLLDAPDADVTIVRMTRRDDVNPVAILPHEQLRELWQDPLLRYSNILDGLFHRGAILCEADTDARYYGAVLNESRSRRGLPPHDLLLTYSSGIARLAMIVRALRAVDVPAAVIVDLDALRDETRLRGLVEALGGNWDDFQRDWQIVHAAVQGLARNPSLDYVREQVEGVLGGVEGATLPAAASKRLREATRVEDGWSQAKRGGIQAIPQGDATQSSERLLEALRGIGLFVVPVGELERWEPAVPNHGTAWVNEVLDRQLHVNPTNGSDAFIEDVAATFE